MAAACPSSGHLTAILKAERSGRSAVAKHSKKRRRRFRKYLRGQINQELNLGTLNGSTLISGVFGDSVTEKTWISSVLAAYSLREVTQGTAIGPVMVGIAHSDYGSAEIEEFIENSGSWEAHDLVQQEIAKRKIRIIGVFDQPATAIATSHLNDGKKIHTKCNWMLGSGQTLRLWAYNLGSAAFATTAPKLEMNGHANLWPA